MRFHKGESGNPAGRPRGALNRATVLAQELLAARVESIAAAAAVVVDTRAVIVSLTNSRRVRVMQPHSGCDVKASVEVYQPCSHASADFRRLRP